jgi:hypothetical protein
MLGEAHRALGLEVELHHAGLLEIAEEVLDAGLVAGDLAVDLHRLAGVGADERLRLLGGSPHGLDDLRVRVGELGRGEELALRQRPADDVGRAGDDVRPRHGAQFDVLERRRREVGLDLVGRVGERDRGVGMAELHRVGVEAARLVGAPDLARRHLQQDRLGRDLDGRHRDLVAGRDVLDRPDLRVAADEQERQRRGRHDALHAAPRAVPEQQQVADPGVDDVDPAGEQRVGLAAAAAEGEPLRLHARHAEALGVLLDQPPLLDDVGRQVDDAGLARDRDLALLLRQARGCAGQEHAGGEEARREGAARGRLDHERSPDAALRAATQAGPLSIAGLTPSLKW